LSRICLQLSVWAAHPPAVSLATPSLRRQCLQRLNLCEALAKFGKWTIEIVKRTADAAGFQLLPRRWVVERTLAWLNRNRRLAKDFEASIASARAWVYIASVQLLIRRLA
jgi:transposase